MEEKRRRKDTNTRRHSDIHTKLIQINSRLDDKINIICLQNLNDNVTELVILNQNKEMKRNTQRNTCKPTNINTQNTRKTRGQNLLK